MSNRTMGKVGNIDFKKHGFVEESIEDSNSGYTIYRWIKYNTNDTYMVEKLFTGINDYEITKGAGSYHYRTIIRGNTLFRGTIYDDEQFRTLMIMLGIDIL